MIERIDLQLETGAEENDLQSWFSSELDKYENDPDYLLEVLLLDMTEQLVRAMEEEGVSRAELARRLGRGRSFITKLLDGHHNTTLKTVVRTAHALGKTVSIRIADPSPE